MSIFNTRQGLSKHSLPAAKRAVDVSLCLAECVCDKRLSILNC